MTDVLIVSVLLDEPTQARLDALRRAHFPPERNHLAAHVTFFHALPFAPEEVAAPLAGATARAPVPVVIGMPRLLGRGVALPVESPDLLALRRDLAAAWDPWLTAQDRGKRELHATVQNKVSPAVARALHADLTAASGPSDAVATGLGLWRYLGGPWEEIERFPFRERG
jgi:hypothetical protein